MTAIYASARRYGALALIACALASCQDAKTDGQNSQTAAEAGPLLGGDIGTSISAQDVTGDYLADPGNGENWPSAGYSYDNQRFSPLDQINSDTIGDLGLLWSAPLGETGWRNSSPIAVDGRIYIGDPTAGVAAYDAISGQRVWQYDPKIAPAALDEVRCAVNAASGVAIARGRLFFGQRDGRLTALDSSTGAMLWSSQTSENGRRPIVGVPLVVGNHVIVGNSPPCSSGTVAAAGDARGYISGYIMQDGQLGWRFYTVPTREQVLEAMGQSGNDLLAKAAQSWTGVAGGDIPGGGFVPGNIAFDSRTGDLLFGTAERSSTVHPESTGRALFTSSVIALNPDTGRYKWHRQLAPNGVGWSANAPILFAPLRKASEPGDADETDDSAQADSGKNEATDTPPAASPTRNTAIAWMPLANGWLITAEKAADFVAHTVKYGGGFSPVRNYSSDDGNAVLNEQDGNHRAEAVHDAHMPISYSPQSGLLYLHRSAIRQATDEGADEDATPATLAAFAPGAGKPAWTIENAGAAPLVTAGGLLFARYKAPFGNGLGIFDAESGKRLYFRADIIPIGGMASFLAGGRQMVAFPALMNGTVQMVVMGLGGRLRPDPPEEE